MKNYELKNKLNDYDKLIDLYRNFILLSPDLLSLTPQVKVTKKDDTLKFQAFGKVAEVRFTMVIKDDISQGKITAFLLGTENCQPFERELFTNLFDTLGNFKGERPLISCGLDEDNSQLNLIHFILRSLIEKEMTVSGWVTKLRYSAMRKYSIPKFLLSELNTWELADKRADLVEQNTYKNHLKKL